MSGVNHTDHRRVHKVLMYINSLGGGGAERVMSGLATAVSEEGVEVVLVTSFRLDSEYKLGKRVRRESIEDEQIVQSKLKRNYTRISALRSIIKRERPDIVLSFMPEPTFRALLASIGLGCKLVCSVRNAPSVEYSGIVGSFLKRILIPLRADGCVFQTEAARSGFPSLPHGITEVIPNPISHEFFSVRPSGARGSYWVAAGRLEDQKDYPTMLTAFRKVVDCFPDERLRIYGEGGLCEELSHLIDRLGLAGNVRLMGRTDSLPSAFGNAKGFLMSSRFEGMPNALAEAMAAGLASVSCDCPVGGPAYLTRDGKDGLLVDVGNSDQFAEAIISLLDDPGFAKDLAGCAKKRAKAVAREGGPDSWLRFFETVLASG